MFEWLELENTGVRKEHLKTFASIASLVPHSIHFNSPNKHVNGNIQMFTVLELKSSSRDVIGSAFAREQCLGQGLNREMENPLRIISVSA